MTPVDGQLDVAGLAAEAAELASFDTEPAILEQVEVLHALYELGGAPGEAFLPAALHPSIPPTLTWLFYRCPDGPLGPFTLAQLRIGARTGNRPRGFLLRSYVDSPRAARELEGRWGFTCRHASVRLDRSYFSVRGTVVGSDGATLVDLALEDPEPIAGKDLMIIANMNLARTPRGPRLLQVDPEYAWHRADRGRPVLRAFDPDGWGDSRIVHAWPVSAASALADVTLPALRYVSDPDRPGRTGTESLERERAARAQRDQETVCPPRP